MPIKRNPKQEHAAQRREVNVKPDGPKRHRNTHVIRKFGDRGSKSDEVKADVGPAQSAADGVSEVEARPTEN